MSIIPENFEEIEQIYSLVKQGEHQTLAFTSSQGKEGVSSVILSLAKRASIDNNSVLIIDLNSLSSLCPDKLSGKNWQITDFESQGNAISCYDDYIDILGFPEMSIEDHIRLKDKERLLNMINYWKSRYSFIFFDTSALNAVNSKNISPVLISSCCDATALVVAPGRTHEINLINAVNKLNVEHIDMLGIIVNEVSCPPLGIQIAESLNSRFTSNGKIKQTLLKWLKNIEFFAAIKE